MKLLELLQKSIVLLMRQDSLVIDKKLLKDMSL